MADVSRVARKLRTAIQKLATAVEVYHRRLTVDELFQLCASTTASKIGILSQSNIFIQWMMHLLCIFNV